MNAVRGERGIHQKSAAIETRCEVAGDGQMLPLSTCTDNAIKRVSF